MTKILKETYRQMPEANVKKIDLELKNIKKIDLKLKSAGTCTTAVQPKDEGCTYVALSPS